LTERFRLAMRHSAKAYCRLLTAHGLNVYAHVVNKERRREWQTRLRHPHRGRE
jgi:hypothetical protein